MVAKRFFYICAGLLCLALAYHFGAQSATAQAPADPIVGVAAAGGNYDVVTVVTTNGEVYRGSASVPYFHAGNLFSGAPTSARQETWGGVKARYRQGAPTTTQDK